MRKMNKLVLTGIIMAAMALSTACGAAASSTSTTAVAAAASSTSTTAAAAGSTATAIKTMAGADLQAIEDDKDKKETVLVVDVRSPEEYKAGHVTYAINVPIDTFKENYTKLEAWKNKPVILYCNSGKKSGEAAQILVDNGYTDVTNADGVKQYEYKLVTYGNIFASELFAQKDSAFIVDVREAKDYDAAHFANAVNVSVDDLSKLDSLLPAEKDTLIITHCYSGNRSAKAAAYIVEKGYTNVWNTLDGSKEVEYTFN